MDDQKADYQNEHLMEVLEAEESALVTAGTELADAELKFEIASRRFAALRDLVVERLGWPFEHDPSWGRRGLGGGYRFIRMAVGDAVVAALRETTDPLSLSALLTELENGGLGAEEGGVTARGVNAALMKTAGVVKMRDGSYFYDGGAVTVEGGKTTDASTTSTTPVDLEGKD